MTDDSVEEITASKLSRNAIAFSKGLCILPPAQAETQAGSHLAAVIQAELINLGYILDESAYQQLKQTSEPEAVRFHNEVIGWITHFLGTGDYRPLYDGFPQQVMEMSDEELFTNAILHYWTNGAFIPNSYTKARPEAFEKGIYTTITAGDEKRFRRIFTDAMAVDQSLSPVDAMIRDWFLRTYSPEEIRAMLPAHIPFKENLCVLVAQTGIIPSAMTTTDALRVIVYKGGGDVMLPKPTEPIGKFSRPQRRQLLEMLETVGLRPEEMVLQAERWKHVGEVLHPGEYARRFPKTYSAFRQLRNSRIVTWFSRVENEPDIRKKVALLAQRPGYFARVLDSLLRKAMGIRVQMTDQQWQQFKALKTGHRKVMRQGYLRRITRALFDEIENLDTRTAPEPSRLERLFELFWRCNWSPDVLIQLDPAIESKCSKWQLLREIIQQRYIKSPAEESGATFVKYLIRSLITLQAHKRLDFAAQYAQYLLERKVPNLQQQQQRENKACADSGTASSETTIETNADTSAQMNSAEQVEFILQSFDRCADGVSSKVLYELYTHFENRRSDQRRRNIMIKGRRSLIKLPLLPALDGGTIDRIEQTILNILKRRFALLEPLGRCWIDPALKDFPLPTNLRSVSISQKPIMRGMRIPISNPEAKVVRFYVHWEDEDGTQDLDLSATFLGKEQVEHVSWDLNLKTDFSCHSGDVRHRIGDCAEYVDVVIDEAKKRFDYVIVDVRNFEEGTLASVAPTFGYMEREFPESSMIWVPKTVQNSFILSSQVPSAIIVAFDLQTMEYVILDVDSNSIPVASTDISSISQALFQYMVPPKLSVYDLLSWHVEARGGEILPENEKISAETTFGAIDFSEDYVNIMRFMAVE